MHRILTRSARRIIFQPSNSLSKFAKLDRSAAVVPACRWRWAAPEFHMSTSCSSRHLMNESGDKYSGQSFSQQCSLSHWLAMAFPGAQRWDLHISPSLLCFQPNQKSGPSFLRIIESKPCEVMRTKLLSYWAVANVTATSCPIPGSSCKANVKLQIFCEKKLISTNLKPSVSAQTSSCPSVIHSVRQAGQFLSRVWHIHSNNNQATCKIQADLGKKNTHNCPNSPTIRSWLQWSVAIRKLCPRSYVSENSPQISSPNWQVKIPCLSADYQEFPPRTHHATECSSQP